MQEDCLIIHTDGGSRGNPGPAACAFSVEHEGEVIFEQSKFLNTATNNVAEYNAVILALQWLVSGENKLPGKSILFLLDSELVVKQLNNVYKIKKTELQILNQEIRDLINQINKQIVFRNVPRDKNKIADALVNKELDKHK